MALQHSLLIRQGWHARSHRRCHCCHCGSALVTTCTQHLCLHRMLTRLSALVTRLSQGCRGPHLPALCGWVWTRGLCGRAAGAGRGPVSARRQRRRPPAFRVHPRTPHVRIQHLQGRAQQLLGRCHPITCAAGCAVWGCLAAMQVRLAFVLLGTRAGRGSCTTAARSAAT